MTIFRPAELISNIFDKKAVLSIVSGVMLALSFPSADFSFFAWIALIPMMMAVEGTSVRTSFRIGFTCGISAYAIILYWINIVITQYGNLPLAVSLMMYLLLVAWLAMFYGLALMIARYAELAGIKTAFSLPIAWVAFDFIRSFLFSGFPWAMLGHSQYRILPLIQIADIAGVYGITLLVVLTNVVLYRVVRGLSGIKATSYPIKSALVLLLFLSATLFYGFNQLNNKAENKPSQTIQVALIQGNISQHIKWNPEFKEETISTYEKLTHEATKDGAELVVWPESAVPFFFQDDIKSAERLRNLARETESFLLFGSPAHELNNQKRIFLNSAFMISPKGENIGRSDKMHLVPFGEYVPLGSLFPFITKIVVGIGDFTPGKMAVPLDIGRTKIGTLVCYEAIFPELARMYVNAGARVLVNITNDAWFGNSSAPYQHLSIAAFRAIETRTPLIRAANTGITAIIDQNGHIRNMTGLFVKGFRTGEIKAGIGNSIYLKTGDAAAWLALLLTAGISLFAWWRLKNR